MILRRAVKIFDAIYDVEFLLDNKIADFISDLSKHPKNMRTFTIGPKIRTEYERLEDMPLDTVLHEYSHIAQWHTGYWPKDANFLLNYFVLKAKTWEAEARKNVALIKAGTHPFIKDNIEYRKLFKQ